MAGAAPGSDLGRRIRHRREELALDLETAAAAANVDAGYLRYLETTASPDPSRGTLLRLAVSLGTSPAALLGGDEQRPPGRGSGRPPAELIELDAESSMDLISPGGVGRVVFVDSRGPVALPVNYEVRPDGIVFRTDDSASIAAAASEHRISFEADRIDEAFSEGWSVLVTGMAHRVDDQRVDDQRADDQRARCGEIEGPASAGTTGVQPWVEGHRDRAYVLEPELVTGRQLRRPTR